MIGNQRNSSFSWWACLLNACLASCCEVAAAQPQANRCDEKRATEQFLSGMEQWNGNKWGTATEHLEKAANLCPVPPRPLSVKVAVFYRHQYLPFYYLGDSYYNLDDFPNALRNFYLASWRREIERLDKEANVNFSSNVDSCKRWFDRAGVGERNSYFSDALKLKNDMVWERSAERMWEALQVEKETGAIINASGRWPDPYLPRLWLARALAKLGCYQSACDQLDRSLINQLSTKTVEVERKEMAELQAECKSRRNEPITSELCRRWRCWLKMGGLQAP